VADEGKPGSLVNSKLGKLVVDGMKTYTLGGKQLFPAYPVKDRPMEDDKPFVGRGGIRMVHGRRNQDKAGRPAPIVSKTMYWGGPPTSADLHANAKLLNEIASRVISDDPQARRHAPHFALEVVKEVRLGKPTTLARRIDGFTLKEYRADPELLGPELPEKELEGKIHRLFEAIDWLAQQGYVQGDVNWGNVMFDRDTKELVLIDFDRAARVSEVTLQKARRQREVLLMDMGLREVDAGPSGTAAERQESSRAPGARP
jgi:hypothetical protein